ncbi:TonB-dependent receptor [Phyllobacterium sp. P30BS-XVII]|uniref:TonB-dependent receptor plug domain-containing protein n=1 Tax=Phyllobacterium sp. P30BS-XVII TaxID=2587046 RepID=UPI0015FC6A0C|nr:TonB-dependent receptor [Phyllobacterium sp. P30BS-XVII]MBA8903515.1 vitamin B12 transporter [Phyllobacterium sp. P30BS-XVII]
MLRQTGFAGAIIGLLSGVAIAQEPATDGDGTIVLAPIYINLGESRIDAEKSGRAYTVITGEQLVQNQTRYVADALRQVPGFAVSRGGSYGGLTQVRVRGAEANHLLVMIDGVEASETGNGEFDFGGLPVTDVDHIEILRGPQSAFWGSNALAGVVNIITKGGTRDGFKISGRSEAGTDGTWLGNVLLQGGADNYDFALSGTYRQNKGFNISNFGSEKDGDKNGSINGKFKVDITPDVVVDGTFRYVNRRSDLDPDGGYGTPFQGLVVDGDDQTTTKELLGSLGITWTSLDGALTQKARISDTNTLRDNLKHDEYISGNEGNRLNGSYQATYKFDTPAFADARHQITAGYQGERETFQQRPAKADFNSPYFDASQFEKHDRTMHSFVGEYRGEFFDQLYLNAAARHDDNDRFKDASTYSFGAAWKIPDWGTRLHSSVGTGVTNPTFYDQFGYIPSTYKGNPNLRPEKSLGWDFGVEQSFFDEQLVVDVTYFRQNLTDEITSIATPDFRYTPVNQDGRSKRQGVEVAATLNLTSGFTTTATYTYTDAKDPDGQIEIRRPRHSGSLNAAYTFLEDRARVFSEVTFNGKMEDTAFTPPLPTRVVLKDYTLVTIGGSYKFSDKMEAYARIENLVDEDYQEVFGFNTPGRTAFVGLKGSF